jgi:hypothetical protein
MEEGVRRADALIVLALTAPVAFAALGLRDLAGEEIVFYGGLGPFGILRQALDPASAGSFHAHQPLSYLVKWAFVSVLGESPATLRLHAAGFAVLGALATWWVASRAGHRAGALLAGLVVGWSPLLAFHAHEASGYAATPFFGALTLAGLIDLRSGEAGVRRTGAALLAGGLIGGVANDFFFGFPLLVAAVLSPWSRREARRAWVAVVAVLGPAGAIFTSNFLDLDPSRRLAPHVDPATGVSFLGEIGRAGGGLVEGFLHGYTRPADERDLATLACAVVLLAAVAGVIGLLARTERAVGPGVAGAFAVGTVAVGGVASAVFQGMTGSEFSVGPRAFLAVLPALGVLVCAGPRLGLSVVAGLGILAVQLVPAARTVLDPPRGMADVAARLREQVDAGDYLYGTAVHRVALSGMASGAVSTSFDGCLGGVADLADVARVWLIASRADAPLPGCTGPLDLPAAGFVRTLLDQHPLPDHEAWSPAYLPEVHLSRWDRALASESGPFIRWIEVQGRLPTRSIRVRLDLPDGVVRYRITAPGGRLALRVPAGTLATPTLLGPDGRVLMRWAPRLVTGPRSEQVWTLYAPVAAGTDRGPLLRLALGLWAVSALGYAGALRRRSQGTKLDAA